MGKGDIHDWFGTSRSFEETTPSPISRRSVSVCVYYRLPERIAHYDGSLDGLVVSLMCVIGPCEFEASRDLPSTISHTTLKGVLISIEENLLESERTFSIHPHCTWHTTSLRIMLRD